MDNPPVIPPAEESESSPQLVKADWFFIWGLALTFILAVGCGLANFIKPGSVPCEIVWAFGAVVLGHKISADKFIG